MNKQSHIHKKADSSASNPVRSQLQSRPFIAQAKPQPQKPLTQTQTENQEFQQQKFEATKLELQAKYDTITPEGQERLTVLQAKMSGLLHRRLQQASSNGSNFANIPISRPDAPSQPMVQTKLTIGAPGDKYEQEADRVAAQVVNQIHAPVPQQAGQNVQREEISEEEKDLQMKPMLQLRSAVSGMTATADVETGIQQARGGGQPLAANIQQPMEQAFGADFSKVKVHTDTKADQLNQSIQAKAFTTGQDVFFRKGEYNPGSRGGQELIAHELTHVVQQTRGALQRTPQPHEVQRKQLTASTLLSGNIVQRVFMPGIVSDKTHLRANNAGNVVPDQKIEREIPSGAEVIIDPNQQQVETRRIRNNVTWIRAVNVTGRQWNPATDRTRGGFIRNSKVNPKTYPETVTLNIASKGQLNLQQKWHENIGEYIVVEDSIDNAGIQIVRVGEEFQGLDANYQLHDLTPLEQSQIYDGTRDVSREYAAKERLRLILINAANANGIDPNLLAIEENVESLKRPLRLEVAREDQLNRDKWNTWSQAVYTKIESGATDLVRSLNHWKTQLSPLDPEQCQITRIKLEGSDLHDRGLGATFVDFTKPLGGIFPEKTNLTVVLKPEDRNIEKSLFGKEPTSLANQVNTLAGLNPADAITQIEMETHANFGSIIEFVQGQQAKAINGTGADTQAMSEGIAFAFLAGLSDVHQDNVIWHDGKPYFIDADNALNESRLKAPSSQSGFSQYNKARTQEDIEHIANDPASSRSAIIQALLADSTPLINAVQAAYTNKTGRIVPIYTNFWANQFKLYGYISKEDGNENDQNAPTSESITRWYLANKAAAKLPRGGQGGVGEGLVGEAGIAATGEHFDERTEAAQIKVDLDQGKIPFYHYNYTTGHVLHNGQVIWHGQTLVQAMAILLQKFPARNP